jgi:hypothetical protein
LKIGEKRGEKKEKKEADKKRLKIYQPWGI